MKMRWMAAMVLLAGYGWTCVGQPAPEAKPAPAATEVMTADVAKELGALAQKTNLPLPQKIVCLGDSITQPYKHQPVKYPEMLAHALRQKFGDKVEVVNAGKGGDSVSGALKRVETDVIAKEPTLVFINLGVNDSKLVAPAFERNQIPIDRFNSDYRALVKTIQDKTKARVVLVGTIACVAEWTEKKATGGEKKSTWYGKPEELKKYNAAAQQVAKELNCDYIDLYDHFLAQPDLTALFAAPDGVHCRDRGQELIALQLMRYLQKTFPGT